MYYVLPLSYPPHPYQTPNSKRVAASAALFNIVDWLLTPEHNQILQSGGTNGKAQSISRSQQITVTTVRR